MGPRLRPQFLEPLHGASGIIAGRLIHCPELTTSLTMQYRRAGHPRPFDKVALPLSQRRQCSLCTNDPSEGTAFDGDTNHSFTQLLIDRTTGPRSRCTKNRPCSKPTRLGDGRFERTPLRAANGSSSLSSQRQLMRADIDDMAVCTRRSISAAAITSPTKTSPHSFEAFVAGQDDVRDLAT